MRRAAFQASRAARRPVFIRRTLRARSSIVSSASPTFTSSASSSPTSLRHHVLGNIRNLSTSPRNKDPRSTYAAASVPKQLQLLTSSMQIRNLSVALISGVVASGAYFAYRGGSSTSSPVDNVPTSAISQQARSMTNAAGEAGRRALVVERGALYTSVIPGQGPLAKETDDYGRKVLEMMTPEQATARLRKNEESWLVDRGTGVVRYDVVQIPSNDPIEDDRAEKIVDVTQDFQAGESSSAGSAADWMFWGVFDGHSGWTTSAKLRQVLISYVARELNSTYKSTPSLPTPESIDRAIKAGFRRLDDEIVHESVARVAKAPSKRLAAELLAPALSGSCALLSFYDSRSKMLRVACTGDSRAVLGRRSSKGGGKWTATALSADQTGSSESEAARMRREHPGEPEVVMNGRVLGQLEPTRAFGDAAYKWSIETQERIKAHFFGRTPNRRLRTPPYVTAEPVVTTTKVQPEQGDFVVMATDGLWEMLTNEEVVGLVGQWVEEQERSGAGLATGWSKESMQEQKDARANSWLKGFMSGGSGSGNNKGLPVEMSQQAAADNGKGQKAPIRQRQWGMDPQQASGRFVVQDKNAATHLVRNALGGRDQDQLCALLTLPSPYSRRYRDDLTVEVIFFGQSGTSTGNVTLNYEASAAGSKAQPKL